MSIIIHCNYCEGLLSKKRAVENRRLPKELRPNETSECDSELEDFKKRLPCDFHEVLINLVTCVFIIQPTDVLLFIAQLLEAEIDRRTICDIECCKSSK